METAGRQAVVAWLLWGMDPPAPKEGHWLLCLFYEDGERLPAHCVWEGQRVPSLMERYDALAAIGYAVVDGGAEAWGWHETVTEHGTPVLCAEARVRPLGPYEGAGTEPVGFDIIC
ncbi:hypothetical protein JTP67_21350 [Streptomyces sp. S12]|nr:hypothetical protein [Streptomyces sp. S12]